MTYDAKLTSPRAQLEERMRAVKARLWSDPDDKAEVNAELEAIEEELRKLDQHRRLA